MISLEIIHKGNAWVVTTKNRILVGCDTEAAARRYVETVTRIAQRHAQLGLCRPCAERKPKKTNLRACRIQQCSSPANPYGYAVRVGREYWVKSQDIACTLKVSGIRKGVDGRYICGVSQQGEELQLLASEIIEIVSSQKAVSA